ncbi:MFS family permease [Salirhabdus euzebyi]|uniref:MFS family permease n=1 Tax=Salirhabdus euzebyi TaxID=394506 RepID=A0A841Q9D1_9BACI|nr:MFS transporter [Salirhabdus euzebyi]MBB6455101.1 MFS family permease [Salirhabdus euzebyi]
MKNLFKLFQKSNYRNLFLATLTSQMGSVIGMTAFMFYLLDRFSEQPAYATITELMYSLPTLAVFFLVGVLADKMDRQKIAANCDWISSILSIVLLGAVYIGWMPLIFTILFVRSAISKFFGPAETSLVQGVLSKDEYASAAGLNQMTQSMFNLFGSAIGAIIYWNLGLFGAIILDAVTFAASALFIRACKISEDVRLPNGAHKFKELKVKAVLVDFKAGMTYILGHKLLLTLISGFFFFGIVNGGLSVMPAFILKYKLAPETYEQIMVMLSIVFGIGILVGSVVASIVANKLKLRLMLVIGLIVSGSFIATQALVSEIYALFILNAIVALFLPFINIAIGGWLPSIVNPKMMGRVQGWISPLMMLSHSTTLGIIALTFQKSLTIEALFWIVGGCLTVVGVFFALLLPRFDEEDPDQAGEDVPIKETKEIEYA